MHVLGFADCVTLLRRNQIECNYGLNIEIVLALSERIAVDIYSVSVSALLGYVRFSVMV